MKILFITDLFPVSENEKTTPKTLLEFVKIWQSFGEQVTVLKPNFLLNSFIRKKPYYKTGQYENIYNANYLTPFWGNIKHKIRPILKNKYDIVVAHMPSGILFADRLGLPFVAGIHNSDLKVLTKPLYKMYFKKKLLTALQHSKAIACRSFVIRNRLLSIYPEFEEKTFVCPSGIEKELIKIDVSKTIDQNKLKVVTCANLIKRKNTDKVILAVKDNENIELTVIGDGKELSGLKKIAGENCFFTGRLTKPEVLEKMQNSDIFILPSINETFGMVYLEAMASGCINVCTKNDGIDGIIKDGQNGFLVEPTIESIRTVFSKINKLSSQEINQILQNSKITISQYTSEICGQNYLEKIKSISPNS